MTTNTILFDITSQAFGNHPVRMIEANNQRWFCARDVFTALDITTNNVTFALTEKGIDTADRRVFTRKMLNRGKSAITEIAARGMTFITATAVRHLAQRSTKPAARQFQAFMNGTVATAIETKGAYVHPAVAQEAPDLAAMIAAITAKVTENVRAEFGDIAALKTDYAVLVAKQEEQNKTGFIEKMPLRNYCSNAGTHICKNHLMSCTRRLAILYTKQYGKAPDRETTIRVSGHQAMIFPVEFIREHFTPMYDQIVANRAANDTFALAA